jgi:hypothetical protein
MNNAPIDERTDPSLLLPVLQKLDDIETPLQAGGWIWRLSA